MTTSIAIIAAVLAVWFMVWFGIVGPRLSHIYEIYMPINHSYAVGDIVWLNLDNKERRKYKVTAVSLGRSSKVYLKRVYLGRWTFK
jgi:hypothetical protein